MNHASCNAVHCTNATHDTCIFKTLAFFKTLLATLTVALLNTFINMHSNAFKHILNLRFADFTMNSKHASLKVAYFFNGCSSLSIVVAFYLQHHSNVFSDCNSVVTVAIHDTGLIKHCSAHLLGLLRLAAHERLHNSHNTQPLLLVHASNLLPDHCCWHHPILDHLRSLVHGLMCIMHLYFALDRCH